MRNRQRDKIPTGGRPIHPAPVTAVRRGGLVTDPNNPSGRREPVGVPVDQEIYQRLIAEDRARAQVLAERGTAETLERFGNARNGTAVTELISYQVPEGFLAEVRALAVVYSDPAFERLGGIGWRLRVAGSVPSQISSLARYGWSATDRILCGVGSLSEPMEIESLYVRGGVVIALDVDPGLVAGLRWAVTCRVSGRLWRLSTGGR